MAKRGRKAQGAIVVSVLIILIVIVIIIIVWNIVFPLVREKSQQVEVGSFITDLSIGKASVGELGNLKVTLTRGGQGELDGIKFVFYNEEGKSAIEDRYDVLNQLETKDYYFSSFGSLGKISKVEVYPLISNKLGIKDESQTVGQLSLYLVLSWKQGDLQPVSGLSFNNNLGISFWVNGNEDKSLLKQNCEIKIASKKIIFSYNGNDWVSDRELTLNWNHVAVSIGPVSNIYINNELSNSFLLGSFNSNGDIVIGDIDNLMIFNESLYEDSVSSLYNSQKK